MSRREEGANFFPVKSITSEPYNNVNKIQMQHEIINIDEDRRLWLLQQIERVVEGGETIGLDVENLVKELQEAIDNDRDELYDFTYFSIVAREDPKDLHARERLEDLSVIFDDILDESPSFLDILPEIFIECAAAIHRDRSITTTLTIDDLMADWNLDRLEG
jgi:hypothetical protein